MYWGPGRHWHQGIWIPPIRHPDKSGQIKERPSRKLNMIRAISQIGGGEDDIGSRKLYGERERGGPHIVTLRWSLACHDTMSRWHQGWDVIVICQPGYQHYISPIIISLDENNSLQSAVLSLTELKPTANCQCKLCDLSGKYFQLSLTWCPVLISISGTPGSPPSNEL